MQMRGRNSARIKNQSGMAWTGNVSEKCIGSLSTTVYVTLRCRAEFQCYFAEKLKFAVAVAFAGTVT